MTLTYEDVSKLITEQNELNFGKCMEGADSGASKICRKGATSFFLTANDIHLPKFSGDPGEDVKQFLR